MRIVVLDNGDKIVTGDGSVITPMGVEVVHEVPLDKIPEKDIEIIKKNLKNDKLIDEKLTKFDPTLSIKIRGKK